MRTPQQIIGEDAYLQLVFEGYRVVPEEVILRNCECGGEPSFEWAPEGRFWRRAVCKSCDRKTKWAVCGHGDDAVEFWNDRVWDD